MREDLMNRIGELVKEMIGVECKVSFNKVEKNNGLVLQAVVIKEPDMTVWPSIYINKMLDALNAKDIEIEDVAKQIVQTYMDSKANGLFGEIVSGFKLSKELILNNVTYKLVNRKKNDNRLVDAPHKDMLDLTAMYYVIIAEDDKGTSSFLVRYHNCIQYDISLDELDEAAYKNTEMRAGFNVQSMSDMMGMPVEMSCKDSNPMYVMTNSKVINGATIMMYERYFKELAEKLNDDLYILPSSIHEVLAIPVSFRSGSTDELVQMVGEINGSEVAEDEILSYSVYRYDRGSCELKIV